MLCSRRFFVSSPRFLTSACRPLFFAMDQPVLPVGSDPAENTDSMYELCFASRCPLRAAQPRSPKASRCALHSEIAEASRCPLHSEITEASRCPLSALHSEIA
jgi:hypothetical protein